MTSAEELICAAVRGRRLLQFRYGHGDAPGVRVVEPHALARFAARASDDPEFFGYPLRSFATSRLLSNAALAAWLGVSEERLTRVRICGTPRNRADVAEIAGKHGGSVNRMCEVMGW